MKIPAAVVIAAAFMAPCFAQAVPHFHRLSGQQLIDMLALPAEARDHRLAKAYIDGVLDASEGSTWCTNVIWQPDALAEKVIWGLRALPPEKLKHSAAPLVVDVLHGLLPCPEKK